MILIGMLVAGLVIGLYLGLLFPLVVFAIYATFRFRGRVVLATWGLVAWLVSGPILTELLHTPSTNSFEFQGSHLFTVEIPRIVESLGLAALVGFGVTSPVFLVPLVRALRSSAKPLGPRIQPA
jgi:hypothetical protein